MQHDYQASLCLDLHHSYSNVTVPIRHNYKASLHLAVLGNNKLEKKYDGTLYSGLPQLQTSQLSGQD